MIQPRDDLVELSGYHSPQIDVAIRLNTNESPFPPPREFSDRFAAAVVDVDWRRYPDRSARELRAEIAELHGVAPDMVFVANGSNEVLQTLLLTYAGPGRTVATFEPTYQMHAQIARTVGSAVVQGLRKDDFTLDPATVQHVLQDHDPEVTFLTSPNNPTGTVEPPAMVELLLDESSGLVIVDEAYAEFAAWTALTLVNDNTPLVVTRTFSKTWAMAGLRLGYAIAPSEIVRELEKVALPYHLDTAKQIAGRLALGFVDEMSARVDEIVAERERVSAACRALAVEVVPSQANFVLFRPRTIDAAELWHCLIEDGVMVRNTSGWPNLDGYLRVTIGTPAENDAFLAAMKRRVPRPHERSTGPSTIEHHAT